MGYIEQILSQNGKVDLSDGSQSDLDIHQHMIDELTSKFGTNLSVDKAKEVINDYIAETCRNILCNTAVFKNDEKGLSGLDRFINEVLK
jgi:galactose-1-phosphate uridylyltransferase